MIDITKLVKQAEPSEAAAGLGMTVGFEVQASDLYPAMVAHIKEILEAKKGPSKFLDTEGTPNPLAMYWDDAKKLGAQGMDLALERYDDTAEWAAKDRTTRNAALECCRKWFTELLHQRIGGKPMGLRILSEDKAYKLS